MKAVSAGLAAHLAGQATTLATLWRVQRRDGVVFTFRNHAEVLIFTVNYRADQ
jgi:hypothetical protein